MDPLHQLLASAIVDGVTLSEPRHYGTLRLDLPLGFESCYGAPPKSEQHRGETLVGGAVQGTRETFSAAADYYRQQLKGFTGIIDEAAAPLFGALMAHIRSILSPTFGPLVGFRAHGRIYAAAPESLFEDGSDPNSPMRGARPLIIQLDYIAQNPHAIDEIGTTLVSDLVQRGIGVGGPLTAKLPAYLKTKNLDLLAAALLDPESLPVLAADLPAAPAPQDH